MRPGNVFKRAWREKNVKVPKPRTNELAVRTGKNSCGQIKKTETVKKQPLT